MISPPGQAAASSRPGTLAAAGMALFMAIGLALNGYAIFSGEPELLPPGTTVEEMLDGTASKEIAANLAKTAIPGEMAKWQRGLNWLLAGDLGPKVRQGCPNWLFLADELVVHPHRTENAAARLQTVQDIQKKLNNAGIKLLVAVVPDKSRIMSAQLCEQQRPTALSTRAQSWVQSLQQAGVAAIDLTPTLQQPDQDTYLRTDTHWNEHGAQLAAQAIAAEALKLPSDRFTPHQTSTIEPQEPKMRPGDLVRLAGIEWLPLALQPKPEVVSQSKFRILASDPPSNAGPQEVEESDDDLFGDAELPTVALIGTSFSGTSGFTDFLSHALETPVASFAKDGGEFSGSAKEYFDSQAFKQTPPKIIIWEIPERDLDAPLHKDKEIWR
ncbi:alginate O-acetyltransferase AlgX-related protein [Mesopusillimonas faecipullorum]|uniref:alginate O-acetyltransferase AlgX-related protein n=1 Tax=Mesopusillimonas faecipullorum TaxID=2755040 RepID=UPI001D003184|nr:cell division protein FtsQ [Mesopusillimonas faecipullorum]